MHQQQWIDKPAQSVTVADGYARCPFCGRSPCAPGLYRGLARLLLKA
ncbi:hypothetical protein VRB67_10635 [Pseudomonas trivialis]